MPEPTEDWVAGYVIAPENIDISQYRSHKVGDEYVLDGDHQEQRPKSFDRQQVLGMGAGCQPAQGRDENSQAQEHVIGRR